MLKFVNGRSATVVIPIFRPILLMGGNPQTLPTIFISVFVSPFFVLWYPSMILDNLGAFKSVRHALTAGKRVYWKLALCIFASLLPFTIYFGYVSISGANSAVGYYITLLIGLILSLFSMVYLFNIHVHDSLHAHNIKEYGIHKTSKD